MADKAQKLGYLLQGRHIEVDSVITLGRYLKILIKSLIFLIEFYFSKIFNVILRNNELHFIYTEQRFHVNINNF